MKYLNMNECRTWSVEIKKKKYGIILSQGKLVSSLSPLYECFIYLLSANDYFPFTKLMFNINRKRKILFEQLRYEDGLSPFITKGDVLLSNLFPNFNIIILLF